MVASNVHASRGVDIANAVERLELGCSGALAARLSPSLSADTKFMSSRGVVGNDLPGGLSLQPMSVIQYSFDDKLRIRVQQPLPADSAGPLPRLHIIPGLRRSRGWAWLALKGDCADWRFSRCPAQPCPGVMRSEERRVGKECRS